MLSLPISKLVQWDIRSERNIKHGTYQETQACHLKVHPIYNRLTTCQLQMCTWFARNTFKQLNLQQKMWTIEIHSIVSDARFQKIEKILTVLIQVVSQALYTCFQSPKSVKLICQLQLIFGQTSEDVRDQHFQDESSVLLVYWNHIFWKNNTIG